MTMSGAGVASRAADPVSLPVELPVRLYMRALRQYQKLIDLKRVASKDKVSIATSLTTWIGFVACAFV